LHWILYWIIIFLKRVVSILSSSHHPTWHCAAMILIGYLVVLIFCFLCLNLIFMLWLTWLLARLMCFFWRYNLVITNSRVQCQISCLHII
jgi:hypothetical protein